VTPRTLTFTAFAVWLGVKLTRAQRVAASVAFDRLEPRDLPEADRAIAAQLFGDVAAVPESARAVFVAVAGARSGKSYVFGALYALWRALVADLSSLAPGEVASAVIVAPDLRLARQTLRYVLGAAKKRPEVAQLIEAEGADSFTLRRPDGRAVTIECLPATRGGSALRGRSLVCAVLDESAFFRDESAVVNDAEVFRAVAPRVIPGGLVVVVSTPWAEAGLLFELYESNFGHPATALVAHAPTTLLRDDARTASMVAREYERDAENGEREFGARFMGGGAGLFFPTASIAAAFIPDLLPSADGNPTAAGAVGIGADIALVRDSSAICAVRQRDGIFTVTELVELRPAKGQPLKLSAVIAEFCEFTERHGASRFLADQHALEPAREHTTEEVSIVAAPGGMAGKESTYVAAKKALIEGRVRIPAQYRRLAEQLRVVVAKATPGGGMSISSPRRAGAHGDLVSAWVLAMHAARVRRPIYDGPATSPHYSSGRGLLGGASRDRIQRTYTPGNPLSALIIKRGNS
jgi:hypothetical protein